MKAPLPAPSSSDPSPNLTWPLTPLDFGLALLTGLAALALYLRTLAPYVIPGDSAEFQVLAYEVGIAHCPGYPVYILLAKLFTFLPLGDISYRVNLFSACMAAAAVAGTYLAAVLLVRNRVAALLAAGALTVSATFWSHAVIAEVYTAGAAFVPPIWISLLLWQHGQRRGSRSRRYLFVAGLCGGLSLGVHSTVAMFALGVLIFLWMNRRSWQDTWLPALLGGILGIVLYLGAFTIVELNAPPANIFNGAYATARSSWDITAEQLQDPIQRMLFIGTAVQWRNALFADWGVFPDHLLRYLVNFPLQFSWLSIFLIITGLVSLFRRDRSQGWLFVGALLAHWFINFNYRIGDIYVFYIPGYVLLAMLLAVGIDSAQAWLLSRWPVRGKTATQPEAGRSAALRPAKLVSTVQIGIALLILGLGIWPRLAPYWSSVRAGSVPFIDEPGYPVSSGIENELQVARRVVQKLPQDAVVFVGWNRLYIYYYAAHIEQGRLDLRFIEPAPYSQKPGLPASVIEFIQENIDTRPIYFADRFPEVERAGFRYQARDFWYNRFFQVVKPGS